MNGKFYKLACLIVAIGLVASMITACTSTPVSTTAPTNVPASSAPASAENTAAPSAQPTSGNANAVQPLSKEKVTIQFLYPKSPDTMDLNQNKMFQELENLTNVHIDWLFADSGDWEEQKALILSSGDLPEVFFGSFLNDMDIMTHLSYFVPLETYIDSCCPNLQKAYAEEPTMRKMITAPDGHIYSLSRKLPMRPKACDVPFINQKWLDKLGLKMPATVDEWYTALKAFKEQDPNGNGLADEIPLTGSAKDNMFDWIRYINPWGITDSLENNYLALDQKTGKPVFIAADERYKQAVAFFHKMFADGIMDNEFITQTGAIADGKIRNESIAIVGTGIAWEPKSQTNPHSDEYVVMPPLAGPNGDRYVRGNDGCIIFGRNEFTITTKCKNPEIAMRWADIYSTDEISIQSYWGPFGVSLQKEADGTITFLPPPEGKNGDVWYWEITCRDHGPKFVSKEMEARIKLPEGSGDGAKLACDPLLKDFVAKPYPLVNYTKEQADQISTLTVDIYSYVRTTWAKWISEGGIETEWDAYINQLNQMGLQDLMKIYQQALDTYNAAG